MLVEKRERKFGITDCIAKQQLNVHEGQGITVSVSFSFSLSVSLSFRFAIWSMLHRIVLFIFLLTALSDLQQKGYELKRAQILLQFNFPLILFEFNAV